MGNPAVLKYKQWLVQTNIFWRNFERLYIGRNLFYDRKTQIRLCIAIIGAPSNFAKITKKIIFGRIPLFEKIEKKLIFWWEIQKRSLYLFRQPQRKCKRRPTLQSLANPAVNWAQDATKLILFMEHGWDNLTILFTHCQWLFVLGAFARRTANVCMPGPAPLSRMLYPFVSLEIAE